MRTLCIVGIALLMIGAEPFSLRQGDAAYQAGELAEAEAAYARALKITEDPGLVAFNQGVLYFQQQRYAEAEASFRRALDDAAAPPIRRERAWFNLGNTLMLRSDGNALDRYRNAIECYTRSLATGNRAELREDVRHNLELAKLLWRELHEREPEPPTPNDAPSDPKPLPQPPPMTGDEASPMPNPMPMQPAPMPVPAPPTQGKTDPMPNNEKAQPTPGPGTLPVLLDTGELQPLPVEQTTEYLRLAAERIQRERRQLSRAAQSGESKNVPNW